MAVPPLDALVAAGFDVEVVVTRADKRRGRGGALLPSPVKQAAQRLGIPVVHRVDELLGRGLDLGVVVAFGQLVKPEVLHLVPMVNLHFSLLPRWRGAAPVERALLAGDPVTGVCLMQLEAGLDTGPVYDCVEVPIGEATADELRARLVEEGTSLLLRCLGDGLGIPRPQEGEPTYAAKLTPEDRRIDWSADPGSIRRVVRLGDAYTTFRGKRLKVLAVEPASAGESGGAPAASPGLLDGDSVGGLRLVRVQPEGKAPMSWADFARGARPQPGELLGLQAGG